MREKGTSDIKCSQIENDVKFSVEYLMFINIQWEWKLGDMEKLRNRGWWDTLPVEFKQISIVLLQGSEITDPKQDLTRMSEWKDREKKEETRC